MNLTLIKNPDESKIILYKIARLVYAETSGSSLAAVEALVSLISNLCITSKRKLSEIIEDENIFESLNKNSPRHNLLLVESNQRDFKMCLRTVQRMLNGNLPDMCFGATRFHHSDVLPDWATSIGYIAEIDGLFFYL
ncbi:MAG TPA: cell wall hydrolase [Alphaproteobacteria bacterium]|nr:cell wall hydrolase [Alphaproteobacteria bacterium]